MFFRLSIGGPILGIFFALIATAVAIFFKKSIKLFLNLLVLTSYASYFIAENFELEVSGILALVSSGLVLNLYMKNYMTNQ